MSTMHLDLGLAQTINRATHVTRGFRHIVMVTAAGDDHPDRLVADLSDETVGESRCHSFRSAPKTSLPPRRRLPRRAKY